MNWNNQITAVRKARRTNGNSVLEKIDNSRLNLAICLSFASLSSGTSQVKRNMLGIEGKENGQTRAYTRRSD